MNKGSGRVLVANRGEIAVRIVRACREEGLEAVVTVSDADEGSLAARLADHVVHIGPSSPAQSYLRVEQVVAAAVLTDCDAVHPGYGFLSERPELAEACEVHGLVFVGPDPRAIRVGGDKIEARRLAASIGVPVGAGSANLASVDEAAAAADEAGYPVLLKAAADGGWGASTIGTTCSSATPLLRPRPTSRSVMVACTSSDL